MHPYRTSIINPPVSTYNFFFFFYDNNDRKQLQSVAMTKLENDQVIAIVLLAVFANLFILCFIVAQCRQKLRTKKPSKNWTAEEKSKTTAEKRLENKKRVWAMFGLRYEGTLEDMKQNDDDDDDWEVTKTFGQPSAATHSEHMEVVEAYSISAAPPPYILPTMEGLRVPVPDGLWGLCTPTSRPPQLPERIHDVRRDHTMSSVIISPRPQRHVTFSLQAPELVAAGSLRRSDTTRFVAPKPANEPERKVQPSHPDLSENQVSEPSPSCAGSEPPLSPKRLDSISRRRNEDKDYHHPSKYSSH